MVLARAVVGDWYRGQEAAKRFSILSVIFAVAPIIAPVLGGLITNVFSWRALFVVLAALSVVLLIAVAVALPESLPPERRHSGGVATAFRSMRSLLAERSFLGYVLVFSFANVACSRTSPAPASSSRTSTSSPRPSTACPSRSPRSAS